MSQADTATATYLFEGSLGESEAPSSHRVSLLRSPEPGLTQLNKNARNLIPEITIYNSESESFRLEGEIYA